MGQYVRRVMAKEKGSGAAVWFVEDVSADGQIQWSALAYDTHEPWQIEEVNERRRGAARYFDTSEAHRVADVARRQKPRSPNGLPVVVVVRRTRFKA